MDWISPTFWSGDNLPILSGLNSQTVDLIYLDPPFNSRAHYAAPRNSQAAGASFKDTWSLATINLAWHGLVRHAHPELYALLRAVRGIHGESMMAYLLYLVPRLMELQRLLKPSGSLYLHCDPTASHYLKLILDALFGKHCFRNEIVWCYTGPARVRVHFPRKHDVILFYAYPGAFFDRDAVRVPYAAGMLAKTSGRGQGQIWKGQGHNSARIAALLQQGKVVEDWWSDITPVGRIRTELTGYPTQKPLALLRRIVRASSRRGEVVLDPFCGGGTTGVAALREGRRWLGIDIAPKAAEVTAQRFQKEGKEKEREAVELIQRTDLPTRSDQDSPPQGRRAAARRFLYGEQGGLCNACTVAFPLRRLAVDPLIPLVEGGTEHISNLQLLCSPCKRSQEKHSEEWLLARLLDKGHVKSYVREHPRRSLS